MLPMSDPTPTATSAAAGSTLIPSLRYRDANAAIAWLERVFGFKRHAVYPGPDNTVQHAELRHGSGMIMLGSASNPNGEMYVSPAEIGNRVTSPLYLIVPDCEPVYATALAAGVEMVAELREMDYGGKAFSLRDPEGYLWSVGEYDPWRAHEATAGSEQAPAASQKA